MLTNDQCIQVAEKVWGWNIQKEQLKDQGSNYCDIDNWLKGKVNSWSGFGKTVEAMAERGYFIKLKPSIIRDIPEQRFERMGVEFIKPPRSKDENLKYGVAGFQLPNMVESVQRYRTYLIEATHLAALEAIKSP